MKKITALLAAAALTAGLATGVYAEETENVIVSVEKLTLGAGFIVEPTVVTIETGASASEAIAMALESNGIAYDGYLTDGVVSYYTAVGDTDKTVNIPGQIAAAIESEGGTVNYTRNTKILQVAV